LDDAFADNRWFYSRFMDEWLFIAPTREALRLAAKQSTAILEQLKFTRLYDTTFIGHTSQGFDFFGNYLNERRYYRQIDRLREYVLIDQAEHHVDVFRKNSQQR